MRYRPKIKAQLGKHITYDPNWEDPEQDRSQFRTIVEPDANKASTVARPNQANFVMDRKPNLTPKQWNIDDDEFDPYFALKNMTTGLSWLSNTMERGRQNQYMRQQLSTLGQMDPIPVDNFQPNPYRLYSKYGGSVKKFQRGGSTQAYKDSLTLYNASMGRLKEFNKARTNVGISQTAWDNIAGVTNEANVATAFYRLSQLNKKYPEPISTSDKVTVYDDGKPTGIPAFINIYKKPVGEPVVQPQNLPPLPRSNFRTRVPIQDIEGKTTGVEVRDRAPLAPRQTDFSYSYRDSSGNQKTTFLNDLNEWLAFTEKMGYSHRTQNATGTKASATSARTFRKGGRKHG